MVSKLDSICGTPGGLRYLDVRGALIHSGLIRPTDSTIIRWNDRREAYRANGGKTWADEWMNAYEEEFWYVTLGVWGGALILNYLMIGSFRFRPWRHV